MRGATEAKARVYQARVKRFGFEAEETKKEGQKKKVQSEVVDDGVKATPAEKERAQHHAFAPILRAATHAADDQKAQLLARARAKLLSENPEGVETIKVRSSNVEPNWDGSARVLLWERHPLYEGGEIFLKCEAGEWEVLLTEKVKSLLRSGALIQVR